MSSKILDRHFRRTLGNFATGVTVVTTLTPEGKCYGLTVNWFSSVSLDPPLVLVCIDRKLSGHDFFLKTRAFCVNILSEEQISVSKLFAAKIDDRFQGLECRTGKSGIPIVENVLAFLECRLVHAYPGGDHTILVGEVEVDDPEVRKVATKYGNPEELLREDWIPELPEKPD